MVKKIIKCFCGCSELSVDDINRILFTPPNAFLNDTGCKQLFINFLRRDDGASSSRGSVENIELKESVELIRLTDLCLSVLNNPDNDLSQAVHRQRRHIQKYLTSPQKRAFKAALKDLDDDNDSEKLIYFLHHTVSTCAEKFHENSDYVEFLDALRCKLK